MKKTVQVALSLVGLAFFSPSSVQSQSGCSGQFAAATYCGNGTGAQDLPRATPSIWVEAKSYCTTVNGVADNTACLTSAAAAAHAIEAGLRISSGSYCIKTAGGWVIPHVGLNIKGPSGYLGVLISTCGSDNKLITLNADSIYLEKVSLRGAQLGASATSDALTFGSSCVRCVVRDIRVAAGYHAIKVGAEYVTLERVSANGAYGQSLVYIQGANAGAFILRGELDTSWPCATPANLAGISARANATVYAANAVVSLGGYYIQTCAGGTSGGSAPALANYESPITDGSVTWKLVAPTTYYGVHIDTGAINNFLKWTDMTGPYTNGLYVSNTLAGTSPQSIGVDDSTIGGTITNGVELAAGSLVSIRGTIISNCVLAACVGIRIDNTFSNQATIGPGNLIWGIGNGSNGIYVGGGTDITVTGNQVFNGATGIGLAANVNKVSIIGNHAGLSSYGTNTTCINVPAGTSDYISIIGNDCSGASISEVVVTGVMGLHNVFLNANNSSVIPPGTAVSSNIVQASAVAVTTATATNITSISVPPGTWTIRGSIGSKPNAATTTSAIYGWVSVTSATNPYPTLNNGALISIITSLPAGTDIQLPVGSTRLTFTVTTTVFLSCQLNFAVNVNACYGFIEAVPSL